MDAGICLIKIGSYSRFGFVSLASHASTKPPSVDLIHSLDISHILFVTMEITRKEVRH